jgi:hypothetical protein
MPPAVALTLDPPACLSIVTIDRVQEIGSCATGVDVIPRRSCKALVFFSDHNRNYAFGLDCRSGRP